MAGLPAGPRGRAPRQTGGNSGGVAVSVMVFLSCLGTVYVGGRLWQDAHLQRDLTECRRSAPTKGQTKPLSVEESIMKIEFGELQKREAMLQVALAEAKARGFVSIAAGLSKGAGGGKGAPGRARANSTTLFSSSPAGVAPRRLLAVVGVNTRFADRPLRDTIRASWMPSQGGGLKKIEDDHGVVLRFIVGRSPNKGDSSDRAISEENEMHKDFLILEEHEEDDHDMARKLKSFYAHAVETWDADFYIKMDDDVYLNTPGLVTLLKEYRSKPRMYMGCMKSGDVVTDPNSRWYEPEWSKFGDGKQYQRHAAGPFHIVSKELALYFAINRALLHEYKHEDVSLGAWVLGLEATYEDNKRLCCASAPEDECAKRKESGKPCVAVYDWQCGGLCEAEKRMAEVHQRCSGGSMPGATARAGA